jgi:hypothetical protein
LQPSGSVATATSTGEGPKQARSKSARRARKRKATNDVNPERSIHQRLPSNPGENAPRRRFRRVNVPRKRAAPLLEAATMALIGASVENDTWRYYHVDTRRLLPFG